MSMHIIYSKIERNILYMYIYIDICMYMYACEYARESGNMCELCTQMRYLFLMR